VHLQAALNVGISLDELKEVAIQLSVYAGFPAAINTMTAIQEVAGASSDNNDTGQS
jgi:4-carboxymuconolactone decarboxylase